MLLSEYEVAYGVPYEKKGQSDAFDRAAPAVACMLVNRVLNTPANMAGATQMSQGRWKHHGVRHLRHRWLDVRGEYGTPSPGPGRLREARAPSNREGERLSLIATESVIVITPSVEHDELGEPVIGEPSPRGGRRRGRVPLARPQTWTNAPRGGEGRFLGLLSQGLRR